MAAPLARIGSSPVAAATRLRAHDRRHRPTGGEGVRLVNLVLVFVMSVLIRVLVVYGYSTFGLHLQREARERAAVPAEVAGRGAPGECH